MVDRQNYSRNLVCIQYPGVVNNPDKAIETLGGMKAISKVYSSGVRRMELRFRPKDTFCKVATSTSNFTPGILLKIRVKKKKQNAASGSSEGSAIIATEVVGVVKLSYSFDVLADFQYLPLAPKDDANPSAGLRCILDELVPTGIPDLEWMNAPVPYFFVPPVFSRMSTPQNYAYNYTFMEREKESDMKNIITRDRKARTRHAIYVNFNRIDATPSEPNKLAIDSLFANCKLLQTLKDHFSNKPICSKNELYCTTKFTDLQLKTLLPCVAYYYLNGPWRGLWVRFGYDPRKDPQSRIYQCMDYRVRNTAGLKNLVKGNRQNNFHFLKERNKNYMSKKFLVKNEKLEEEPKPAENSQDYSYLFRKGFLPSRRQMFYQYCHLKIPEIEGMLARLGEVLPGALCHERRGWLPAGFQDQCREIMNAHISKLARDIMQSQSASTSDTVSDDKSLEGGEQSTNPEDGQNDNDLDGDTVLSEFEYDEDDDDDDDNETEIILPDFKKE